VADINVERKGPSIWPWVVGLIVLALLIWALIEMFGRDDTVTHVPVTPDTVQQPVTTVPADSPFAPETAPTLQPETGVQPEPGAPGTGTGGGTTTGGTGTQPPGN
jgi:hypothetical protein